MTEQADRADDDAMTPREAQDRLAEAFPIEEIQAEADSGDDSPGDDPEADGAAEEASGDVVAMTPGQPAEQTENPFAREAALATAMRKVEAVLFASPTPVAVSQLEARIPGADIAAALEKLDGHYRHRGVNLRQVDHKWQFVTAPDVADVLVEQRSQNRRLSRAALETLAIIAYHQPCTRADIEEVRGVAVAKGSLDQLMELGWVRLRGKRDAPGRPVLYGTTSDFLEHFGLDDVSHLPGMADLKAAGLLEARLPPGFDVPVPKGEDDDTGEADEALDDRDFTADFHDGETEPAEDEINSPS